AEMIELFRRLPKRREQGALPASAAAVTMTETEAVAPLQQAVKQAAESFFLQVVDHGGDAVSAMRYWQDNGHDWPADIWLFQVLAEYDGLPRQQRRQFRIRATEQPHSRFNELTLIRDYTLALVPLAAEA